MVRRFLKKNWSAGFGIACVILALLVGGFAPWISPYDPYECNLAQRRAPPSFAHPFGLDEQGRDVFSRIVHGIRYTFGMGVVTVLIGMGAGVSVGLISGYYGRRIDLFLMRIIDFMMSFPYFLLAIIGVAILGPNLINAVIAVGISNIPQYARVARASALSTREATFVEAAKAIGASNAHIIVRHVIPQAIGPLVVFSSLNIASAILSLAALSFLGLGAQPPIPEWGVMLSRGRAYLLDAPHLVAFPGVAIAMLVLALNLVGDGLRDVMDPKMKGRR